MDNTNMGILIAAFIAVIIGVGFITVIADTEQDVSTKISIADEVVSISTLKHPTGGGVNTTLNVTIANPPTGWKATGCAITSFSLKNGSEDAATITTDYRFTPNTGKISIENVEDMNSTSSNTTYVSYTYCPDGYLTEGWTRSTIQLVPGFFALALLGVGVGLFFLIMKREGLLGQL